MPPATDLGRIWVFDRTSLEQSLARYQADALSAYPQQEQRIRVAVAAIRDFLESEYADHLTMTKGN